MTPFQKRTFVSLVGLLVPAAVLFGQQSEVVEGTDSTVPAAQSVSGPRPSDLPDAESEVDTPQESEGLWPRPKLLRLVLTRMVDDACDRYDMEDDQREVLRGEMVDQWFDYLSNHRNEFQPIFNDFLELRLRLEPPDQEQIEKFAARALPAFDDARDQIELSWQKFREVLTPAQRVRFEMEVLAARAGLALATSKLAAWKNGQFELNDVWEPRGSEARTEAREDRRRRRLERREQIEAEVAAASPRADQVDIELDRWQQYVAEFIERYRLDEGQRTTALSLLAEVRNRASAHRDRNRRDIKELEARIERPDEQGGDRDAIKADLVRLYGPIDELFAELDRRLEPIPTLDQRAAAEEREAEKSSPKAAWKDERPSADGKKQERPKAPNEKTPQGTSKN